MNPNNIFYAPEIINPNYNSGNNNDSQMSEGGTESNGTSYSNTSSSFATVGPVTYVAPNYSTPNSNILDVDEVIYNVGPNETFNLYRNNQQVPEKHSKWAQDKARRARTNRHDHGRHGQNGNALHRRPQGHASRTHSAHHVLFLCHQVSSSDCRNHKYHCGRYDLT